MIATVVVTWFVANRAGLTLDEFGSLDLSTWALNWPILVSSSTVLLAGYFMTGSLWGRIVRDLGGPTLSPSVSVRLFMIANLGRYVPGKIWQIAGLAALARDRGVSGSTATASAVLGQGLSLVAASALGLGAVWTLADGAPWRWAVPVVLLGGIVVGLAPPVFRATATMWFRFARTPEPDRLDSTSAAIWLAIASTSWVLYAGGFWLLVVGLGLDAPPLATASAFAAAYVLGYVMVFAPAGIGVREGFLVALLSPQLGAGAAGAVAVSARLWTTVIEVIPAAVFWARHLTTDDGAPTHGE